MYIRLLLLYVHESASVCSSRHYTPRDVHDVYREVFFFSWVFTRFFSATFSCTRRTHAYTCVHSSFLLLRGSVAAIFNDTCVLILHKCIHILSRRTVLSCIPWPGYTPILYIYSNIYVFRACTPRYYTHIRRRFQYFFSPGSTGDVRDPLQRRIL